MPLHLVHVVHRYPPALGGSEAYFERLTDSFRKQGHSVDVWTSSAIALDQLRCGVSKSAQSPPEPGIRRYPPLAFPLRRYVLKALSLLPIRPWQLLTSPASPVCLDMWRDAKTYDGPLDAVHATAFPYGFPLMCALALARRRKVPCLLTPFLHLGDVDDPNNSTRRQYATPALRWLLKQADLVFVQTELERTFAGQLGVKPEQLVLQGLGVDAAECTGGDRERVRRTWGVSDETFVVGHLANLSVEKGSVDIYAAVENLPNVHLVLAGPSMPNFNWMWNKFADHVGVTKLGVLSEREKRDFFAGIDLFCLPSRTDSFGLVLLEAWANGKPVLCYRAGGPAELVQHGVDGLLCKTGDWHGLADAIRALATNRGQATRMGEAGRLRCKREFRWSDKLNIVHQSLATRMTTWKS